MPKVSNTLSDQRRFADVDAGQAGVRRVGRRVAGEVVLDPVLAPQVDRAAVEDLRLVLLPPAQQRRRGAGVRAAAADVELAGDGPVGVPAVDDVAGAAVGPQQGGPFGLPSSSMSQLPSPCPVARHAEDLLGADGAAHERLADRLGRGDPDLVHVLFGQVRLRVGDRDVACAPAELVALQIEDRRLDHRCAGVEAEDVPVSSACRSSALRVLRPRRSCRAELLPGAECRVTSRATQ